MQNVCALPLIVAGSCRRSKSHECKVYKTGRTGRFFSLFSGKWLKQDLIVRFLPLLLFSDEKSKVQISRIFLSIVRGTHRPYADLRGKWTASVDNLAVFVHKKPRKSSFNTLGVFLKKCLQDRVVSRKVYSIFHWHKKVAAIEEQKREDFFLARQIVRIFLGKTVFEKNRERQQFLSP